MQPLQEADIAHGKHDSPWDQAAADALVRSHPLDRDGKIRRHVGGTRPPPRGQAADGLGREAYALNTGAMLAIASLSRADPLISSHWDRAASSLVVLSVRWSNSLTNTMPPKKEVAIARLILGQVASLSVV